jgi:hypothetical protein
MKKTLAFLVSTVFVLSILGVGQARGRANIALTPLTAQGRSAAIKFTPAQIRETNRRKRQSIKARYPQALGAGGDPHLTKLNQELRKFIDKEVRKFRADAQPPEERTSSSGSTFESKYSVRHAANGFISIEFLIEAYYEGAVHGSYNTIVFNYDLTSGRLLRLADLFRPNSDYLKPISDYAIEALRKEKAPNPDMDEIRSGAGPEEKNYQSWNFTRAGLEISFDPYQVGPYAEGPHEVVVPYVILKDVINPEGPLAKITGNK